MDLDLPDIFAATKSLVPTGTWAARDLHPGKSDWITFTASLEINEITIAGLKLKATAISRLPDRAVRFQLEYHHRRRAGPALARIEWRPLKGHNNKAIGPPEHRHRQLNSCHRHPFDLNWAHSPGQVRRGNLLIAVPIADSPKSFGALLEFVGEEFRINGIERVPQPPWAPELW